MQTISFIDWFHPEDSVSIVLETEIGEKDKKIIDRLVQDLLVEQSNYTEIADFVKEAVQVLGYTIINPSKLTYVV